MQRLCADSGRSRHSARGEHHPDRGQFNVSKCLAFISSLELGQSIAKLDGGGHGQIFPQDPPLFADQGDFNLVVKRRA